MIFLRTFLSVLLCTVNGYSAAALTTEKHFPVENWITFQGAYYKTECDRQTREVEPTKQSKRAMSGREFFCNCAPAGLKAYADSLTPENRGETLSLSAFLNLVKPSIEEACLAAYVRSALYESCLSSEFQLPAGVTDRVSFCQCASTQAKAISEESIRDSAITAEAAVDNAAKAIDPAKLNKNLDDGDNKNFENSELMTKIFNKCGPQK